MSLRSYLRGAGLGILLAAVILTFAGGNKTRAMSDDEVRARAKELGMTAGNEVLAEAYTMATAPEIIEETEVSAETKAVSEPAKEVPAEIEEKAATETVSEAATETASEVAAETASETAPSEEIKSEIKSADEIIEDTLKDKQTTELKSDITGEDKTKSELLADAAETEAESASPVTDVSAGFVSVHINGGSTSTAVAQELEKAGAVGSASAFDAFLCANGYDRRLSTGDFRIPAGASDEEIAHILMRR